MSDFEHLNIEQIARQIERHSDNDPFDDEVVRRLRVGEVYRLALEEILDVMNPDATASDYAKDMRRIAYRALGAK